MKRSIEDLKTLLGGLAGHDLSDAAGTESFLDLGFDSLLLTQAATTIKNKFGVKVTFRQLMVELTTLNGLAAYLDAKRNPAGSPTEAVTRENPPPAPIPGTQSDENFRPSPINSPVSAPAATATETLMERVVREQMRLMERQLELLKNNPLASSASIGTQNGAGSQGATPAIIPANPAPKIPSAAKEVKTSSQNLSPRQQAYIDALIGRYTKRTAKSKALTQQYRQWYADPRTASGFNPGWKEMVYQLVVTRSSGSRLWDIDGNEYIDMLNGFGPNFIGHSAEFLTTALKEQIEKGIEVGPQFPLAGETAKLFCELTGNERASFVCTGSEAVYAAMRLARTATGRNKIVVFTKDYHGNFDEVLVRAAGTPGQLRSVPAVPGIPPRAVEDMYVLDYGTDAALDFIRAHADEIAAVLVEPVQSRRPEWRPKEFNLTLRQLTTERGCLLIFDEVITGLRSGPGGAQAYYGIKADLATYGKVVAGGMPIGIVAGKAEYMDIFDGGHWQYGDDSFPGTGVTFFAGTFVRHPLVIAATHAMLKYLKAQGPELWENLNRRADRLANSVNEFFVEQNIPVRIPNFGSLFFVRMGEDQKYGNLLFYRLREKGIFLLEPFPSYLTVAHTDEDVDRVIAAFKESALELKEAGLFNCPPEPSGIPAKQDAAPVEKISPAPVDSISHESPPVSPPKKSPTSDRFPLAEGQREMWLGAQMSPDAAGPHHACTIIDFNGPFDFAAMRRALAAVVERHEGLRCVFSEDGTEVIVRPKGEVELPLDDLSGLPPVERDKAAKEIVDREGRQIFDLAKGPLIACRVLRLSAAHHQFIFTAQMIACDGWSHYVVFEELGAHYSAFVEGRELQLPPAIPMREYALWQQEHRDDPEAQACQAFWLSKFKDIPAPLDLPTSGPRPPNRTVAADRREINFAPDFYHTLKHAAKEQKSSTFTLLLATFQTWLYRLSGTTDLVVGVPFSAQGPLGFDLLVGQCANTLPLRTRLDPSEPFNALLKRTWADLLDAQENWNYTFGKLAQQLDLPRDPSRIPLVSVLFNIDPPMSKVAFSGLSHRFNTGPRFSYQYDLGFNLVEEENSLRLECDYNRNLFDGDVIQAWLASYEALLRQLIVTPEQSLAKLPMLSDAARSAAFAQGARDENLPALLSLIQAQIDRAPEAIAAVDQAGRLTYAELNQRANSVANYLAELGVGKNSAVVICLERTVDLVAAILGVLRTGAAYAPLSPEMTVEHKTHVIKDSGATVILTHARLVESLPVASAKPVCLDRDWMTIKAAKGNRPAVTIEPDTIAYIIYPPRSASPSPGCEISHRALANFLLSMQREPGITSQDIILALSPLSLDMAVLELLLPLTVGARSIIASTATSLDPTGLVELIKNSGITVMQGVPSTWRALLSVGWKGGKNFRLLNGREALSPNLARRLLVLVSEVWNLYGSPETTVWTNCRRVESTTVRALGRPIQNTTLHLVDVHNEPLPVGVPGELLIEGASLARGYRNQPQLTEQKFISNAAGKKLYRTGDRVRRKAGNVFEYLGRCSRRINVRGNQFDLGEIEAVVGQHMAVDEVTVELRADISNGPALVAYFTRSSTANDTPTSSALSRELRRLAHDYLPDYMRPARWVQLARMPRSVDGKLQRSALPAPPAQVQGEAEGYAAPKTKTQEILVEIWQSTLRIDRVGIHQSFFDLGGQSLIAVRLFQEIENKFSRKLPLSTLFKAPTVEQLAAILDGGAVAEGDWSSLVPIQPQGTLTPLFLVHGAGGNVLLYRTLAGYLTPGRPLYGLQSRGLDGKSESLKTIEAMARAYLAEIRSIQPRGPYLLGGYCLGGTVAYEMAQLLHQEGEEVSLVAMLDTYNFSRALKASFTSFMLEKLKFHYLNFVRLHPGEMWRYLLEKFRLARDGELAHLLTSKPESGEPEGVARATSGPEASVQGANDNAADTYSPRYYPGRITLFKPEANYKFYPDANMGWADLVGELEIVEFPFRPHAMLVEPYVKLLAEALNKSMDKEANK